MTLEIKYSTVRNWYPGDENGIGCFGMTRGFAKTQKSPLQVETHQLNVTWKYPSYLEN
jgi:hypothetical protein